MNESGLTVQVMVESDIAVHTTEGYWFAPHNCKGWNPELCRTGPLFKNSAYVCERGLITGHAPDSSTCKLKRGRLVQTQAEEVSPGYYVLRTIGEVYQLACKGKRQVQESLQIGTYTIHLHGDCVLSGERWRLKGEIRKFANATANIVKIPVIELDLKEMTPKGWFSSVINNTGYDTVEINHNDLNDYVMNDFLPMDIDDNQYTYHYVQGSHHLSWINVFIIVVICIVIVVIGVYAWRKRDKIRFFLADARRAKPKKTPVEHEMNTLSVVEETCE